jgi:chemotaxis protein methyltransferase CheR
MTNHECVVFLQWALPRMRMRWPGFRKVRGQVCKRISRRFAALGLLDPAAYRTYLESNEDEWKTLDSLCRITISRFYRDRNVFDSLGSLVLPRLVKSAEIEFRCCIAGCASGEEAYTIRILWELRSAPSMKGKKLHIIGTDSDPVMLERARKAAYTASSLKDLPQDLTEQAFERSGKTFVLRPRFRENVYFEARDIRESMPEGPFDIILCRNLVFTYFDEALQGDILRELVGRLRKGGVFVIGAHESLPTGDFGLKEEAPAIYERVT